MMWMPGNWHVTQKLLLLSTGAALITAVFINNITTPVSITFIIIIITISLKVPECFLYGSTSSYLSGLLTPYIPSSALCSQSSGLQCVPRVKMQFFGCWAFTTGPPTFWSNLPADIRLPLNPNIKLIFIPSLSDNTLFFYYFRLCTFVIDYCKPLHLSNSLFATCTSSQSKPGPSEPTFLSSYLDK